MDDLTAQEALVEKHLQKNDIDEAVRLLCQLISHCVEQGHFPRADTLRKRLIEVSPFALNEIVKATEMIEAAKNAAIDRKFLTRFAGLWADLSREEQNAVYYALHPKECGPNMLLFSQGNPNSRLFFIRDGQFKLIFRKESRTFLLRDLGPGDIVGDDTFFSRTFCTTSLMTMTVAAFSYLNESILKEWHDDLPGLGDKLRLYCERFPKTSSLLKGKGLERRSDRRLGITGPIASRFLSEAGKGLEEQLKGEVVDISCGGLLFLINTTATFAEMLLGHRLQMAFRLPKADPNLTFERTGIVLSVTTLPFNEYAIHVKFDEPLPNDLFNRLAVLGGKPGYY